MGEISDLLASLEDLRAGQYNVLPSNLSDKEFIRAVHHGKPQGEAKV